MSNNTNDSSLCEIAQQLSVSTALRSIDSLKICLAIVGIIIFTTLLYRKVVDRYLTFLDCTFRVPTSVFIAMRVFSFSLIICVYLPIC